MNRRLDLSEAIEQPPRARLPGARQRRPIDVAGDIVQAVMRAPGIMRAGMVSAIGVMIVLVMVTVVRVLLVMNTCIAGRGLMRVMAPRRGVCACGNRLEQPEL